MGFRTFDSKGPHRLLQAGSRVTRGQITVSGMPNCLNYCVIFVACPQFTNVAVGWRSMVQVNTLYLSTVCFLPGDGPERAEICRK